MTFQESIKTCFSKYADFSGRAPRSEYWWFVLAEFLAGVIGIMIHPILYAIVILGALLPNLAAGARRMHDMGKSGWWLLLSIIPLVGLVVLYWLVQPTVPEANEYGEAPVL
jgi:uncharacterized membrane protein YhaH (DUF805 family)